MLSLIIPADSKYGFSQRKKMMRRVIFFGPSENLLSGDSDIRESAAELANYGQPVACKFLSDRDGLSEHIEGLGITVDYVGSMIADLIKDGFIPMVW